MMIIIYHPGLSRAFLKRKRGAFSVSELPNQHKELAAKRAAKPGTVKVAMGNQIDKTVQDNFPSLFVRSTRTTLVSRSYTLTLP